MAAPEDSLREKNRPLPHAIYCPSCGALNHLDSWKDYSRGSCAECGSPFRLPVRINPISRRAVAYLVFAAVLTACIGMLFFSGGKNFRAQHSQTFPVPAGGPADKVKKFPLPPALIPLPKSALPAARVFPKAAPSQSEAAAGGREEGEKIGAKQAGAKFNQSYDKLIERLLREKSTSPKGRTGDLLDIPLPVPANGDK